jgi:hypothetical protein
MEQHNHLGHFTPRPAVPPAATSEEVLVRDARAGLTPAQMVERKLASLLQGVPLPVSPRQAGVRRRPLA